VATRTRDPLAVAERLDLVAPLVGGDLARDDATVATPLKRFARCAPT
jgi:hypothetical protein